MTEQEKERARRFGAYIRQLRIARGMTQQELANKCGYGHRATISCVEKGKSNIAFDTLPALSQALGVAPQDLFEAYAYDLPSTENSNGALIEGIKGMLNGLTTSQLQQVAAIIKVMHSQNTEGNT